MPGERSCTGQGGGQEETRREELTLPVSVVFLSLKQTGRLEASKIALTSIHVVGPGNAGRAYIFFSVLVYSFEIFYNDSFSLKSSAP